MEQIQFSPFYFRNKPGEFVHPKAGIRPILAAASVKRLIGDGGQGGLIGFTVQEGFIGIYYHGIDALIRLRAIVSHVHSLIFC
jgi:hypothetical protein